MKLLAINLERLQVKQFIGKLSITATSIKKYIILEILFSIDIF